MRRLGAAFGGASKILAQTPMVYQKRAKNTVLTVRAMNEQKTNTHVYEQKRTFRAPKKQKKNVPTRGERSAALTSLYVIGGTPNATQEQDCVL